MNLELVNQTKAYYVIQNERLVLRSYNSISIAVVEFRFGNVTCVKKMSDLSDALLNFLLCWAWKCFS